MRIPLVDLQAQYEAIRPEIDEAIDRVVSSAQFILGSEVAALEEEVAKHLGVRHAVGCASGTDALVLALRALGIGPGDEVIVPSYTFYATGEAVLMVGATPVMVDVTHPTYTIDVEAVEAAITPRTRAVIPVHLFGHPADMAPLLELAREHGVKVIEDNAQAYGARYRGQPTAALGDIGCMSFFPSKNLGAMGDGGMVTTDDPELADRVRMLRVHGWHEKYRPETVGYNSRLDALQAAVLRVNLRHLDEWNAERRAAAAAYRARLAGLDLELPDEEEWGHHVYHLFVVRTPARDRVQSALEAADIACGVYYPYPLHTLAPCRPYVREAQTFPVSDGASAETLALPMFPALREAQLDRIAQVVRRALRREPVAG